MDFPSNLLDERDSVPVSGRGRGSHVLRTEVATCGIASADLLEPLFRVKRWRREPAPCYVDPSPKASTDGMVKG